MKQSFHSDDPQLETLIGQIADEFTQRCNNGEQPDVEEYAKRYPHIARVLRDILPALQILKPPDNGQSEETTDNALAADADSQMTTDHAPGKGMLGDTTPARKSGFFAKISLPDYEMLKVLGRGGMGIVYKARHLGLNRIVALKMIRADAFAEPNQLQRFRTEALAVAQLKHPNIVQIYDIGAWQQGAESVPYFSLEYLEGGTLAEQLNSEPQPPRDAAEKLKALAQAMQAAHELSLIHRDLKPANVLVAADGTLKITDFGLVKRVGDESGQTQTGAIVGTPSYMAPEQADGATKDIGPAADIYALGAILYDMLTGRPPFKGTSVLDTIQQVRHQEPVPPRQLQPGCPKDLETICLKCLEKDPHRRYASAEQLAGDLQAFLDNRPILAKPAGRRERLLKWARRNPLLVAMFIVIALAGSAIMATLAYNNLAIRQALNRETAAKDKEEKAKKKAIEAQKEETKAKNNAIAAGERLKATTYWALVNFAQREYWNGNVSVAAKILNQCPPEHRHFEWHFLNRLCHQEYFTVNNLPWAAKEILVSPNGQMLATLLTHSKTVNNKTIFQSKVVISELRNGNEVRFREIDDNVADIAFHPDGNRLAMAGAKGIYIWDAGNDKLTSIPQPSYNIGYSADGKHLYSCVKELGFVLAAATGKKVKEYPLPLVNRFGGRLKYSPNGKHLAVDDFKLRRLRIFDCLTGQPVGPGLPGLGSLGHFSYSQDGKLIATVLNRVLRIGEVDSGKIVYAGSIGIAAERIFSVALHPRKKWVAFGDTKNRVSLWDLSQNPPAALAKIDGHNSLITQVAFDRSGELLLSSEYGEVKAWHPQKTQDNVTIRTAPRQNNVSAYVPVLSSDGKYAAQTVRMGNAGAMESIVIEAQSGAEKFRVQNNDRYSFSPDGKLAAIHDRRTNRINIHSVPLNRVIKALPPFSGTLNNFRFTNNGSRILVTVQLTGNRFGEVRIFDVNLGRIVFLQRLQNGERLQFSPNGKTYARSLPVPPNQKPRNTDWSEVWSVSPRKRLFRIQGHTNIVNGVAISPDGKRVVTMSRNNDNFPEIKLWHAESGKLLLELDGSREFLIRLPVVFSPDGKLFVMTVNNDTAVLYNAENGTELKRFAGWVRNGLAPFTPDGKQLVLSNDLFGRAGLTIWDIAAGAKVRAIDAAELNYVERIVFPQHGKHFVLQGREKKPAFPALAIVYDAHTAKPIRRISGTRTIVAEPHGNFVVAQRQIEPSTRFDVWDTAKGLKVCSKASTGSWEMLRILQGPKQTVTTLTPRTYLKLWNMTDDKATLVNQIQRNGKVRENLHYAVSADGRFLAVGSQKNLQNEWLPSTVQIHDLSTGKKRELPEPAGIEAMKFSPDGKRLLLAGMSIPQFRKWRLMDTENGNVLYTKSDANNVHISQFTFSPDSRYIAWTVNTGKWELKIIDTTTGKEVPRFQSAFNYSTNRCAFDPQGKLFAAVDTKQSDRNTIIRIYDFATGKEIAELHGHSGNVYRVVFSPDGNRLASAGADATVKIWNPLTGRELLSLPADKLPHEIRFAPDGNRLICVSSEAVRSWNAAELTEKH